MASSGGRRKKKFAKSTSEMSQEMLIETLKKKKECNGKALAVVERLCDPYSFNEEWLLTNLEFINQSHFDDVIVERAIQKLCGYPLCHAKLENMISKKYHISTRLNKVYDISERKNFCSGICYKAGMYLKSQLLTSPLWVRDQEIIPKFKLLPCNSTESMGEEVVFLPEKEQIKQEVLSEKKKIDNSHVKKTCIAFDMKLNDGIAPIGKQDGEESKTINEIEVEQGEKPIKSVKKECETEELKDLVKEMTLDSGAESKNSQKAVKEQKIKNKSVAADPVKKVEKCINEWFSFDTVLYLYGQEKVKDLIKDRKAEIKDIIGKKPLSIGNNERIDRMIQFYSLLEQQMFNSESVNKNLRPLPDYSAIQEDGKKLEVKVKAFYSGQLEVKECDEVEEETQEVENNKESEIYLPTVDTHAQTTLRIKIVLDHFNKIIPELIRTFTRANCFETGELRNLMNHFTLSAHNITFKPGEWYLMGFIIIKLLSVKNKELECLLNGETGRKSVTLFLMNYNLPEDYLERIVEWLLNDESLVRKLKFGEDKK